MKTNALTLLEEMERRVEENQPVSPAQWVEAGIRINMLVGDMDNQIAEFDAAITKLEAEYIKQDYPQAKAKILARNDIDYGAYLNLKATRDRISQFIMLAKKRAETREF